MTDGTLATDAAAAKPAPAGHSLLALAMRRLLRNRAAVAGSIVLALITLFCVAGPWLSPHPYDRVYRSYVAMPPSLELYPKESALAGAMGEALERARLAMADFSVDGDSFRVTLRSDRPIDPRNTRYIERLDEFADPRVVETLDEGRTLVVAGRVNRQLFLMGTDRSGRDLMTRIMVGGRISLLVGLLATFVSLVIGVAYGAIAGFAGGRVDNLMMRFVDVLYSLPFVFFVILLVVYFGRDFVLIFVAIGAVEWLDMARIVRGQTLALKRREFVQAAEALGVGTGGILRRHIVPNLLGPVVVFVTLMVPKIILLESFLSFLGLGVQAPLTSWGVLISEGAANIQSAPYLIIFPSIFFVATLFALNFIGDGLRDALDPRDR
ncbi:ABC transporter permease subunit [Chelatococcus daeguensis]|uniref:Oligopeptide transport system permease protein OppC n=2 Tax=Chelatococcus TaxID=28209 RepID=A0AAC9JS37_9HYPH|nr:MULTISPECIES: ABC transporter permease subunit [Chelatococcus]APF38684.1 peptide ABC transporter permease [Chelatococcus daeguensis]KZE28292.1 peptide ABC transporter permease [Chelatococcus daeguensis]MBM3084344.1 ABC transporter permease subunit [Chelatococcus daeguensis]CUA89427.1 ABC-type dipeptide/oligopeptide/nickel transport system, permease component [Chelatococcus sambhunathii]